MSEANEVDGVVIRHFTKRKTRWQSLEKNQ